MGYVSSHVGREASSAYTAERGQAGLDGPGIRLRAERLQKRIGGVRQPQQTESARRLRAFGAVAPQQKVCEGRLRSGVAQLPKRARTFQNNASRPLLNLRQEGFQSAPPPRLAQRQRRLLAHRQACIIKSGNELRGCHRRARIGKRLGCFTTFVMRWRLLEPAHVAPGTHGRRADLGNHLTRARRLLAGHSAKKGQSEKADDRIDNEERSVRPDIPAGHGKMDIFEGAHHHAAQHRRETADEAGYGRHCAHVDRLALGGSAGNKQVERDQTHTGPEETAQQMVDDEHDQREHGPLAAGNYPAQGQCRRSRDGYRKERLGTEFVAQSPPHRHGDERGQAGDSSEDLQPDVVQVQHAEGVDGVERSRDELAQREEPAKLEQAPVTCITKGLPVEADESAQAPRRAALRPTHRRLRLPQKAHETEHPKHRGNAEERTERNCVGEEVLLGRKVQEPCRRQRDHGRRESSEHVPPAEIAPAMVWRHQVRHPRGEGGRGHVDKDAGDQKQQQKQRQPCRLRRDDRNEQDRDPGYPRSQREPGGEEPALAALLHHVGRGKLSQRRDGGNGARDTHCQVGGAQPEGKARLECARGEGGVDGGVDCFPVADAERRQHFEAVEWSRTGRHERPHAAAIGMRDNQPSLAHAREHGNHPSSLGSCQLECVIRF